MAVSEKTAKEMAKNGAFITGSDICVSITGLAGPDGGTETTPVGLVYIACAYQNELRIREFHFKGNRQKIRELSTVNALTLLRSWKKKPLENKTKASISEKSVWKLFYASVI